jgi:plastocyanin
MKTKVLIPVLFIALLSTLWMFACSKDSSSNNNGGGGTTGAPTITMRNMAFSSSSVQITTGTKVTWVNDDNMTHTVTSDNGVFSSGDITAGNSFSFTFNIAGTYSYHCIYHSTMTGVIVVSGPPR